MDIITILVICVFIILLLGVIVVLKKDFNEVIKGMESIDERIKRIEGKLKNDI